MMLYLDTSALVKLYMDEPLSHELSAAVEEAEAVHVLPMLKPWRRLHDLPWVSSHRPCVRRGLASLYDCRSYGSAC